MYLVIKKIRELKIRYYYTVIISTLYDDTEVTI